MEPAEPTLHHSIYQIYRYITGMVLLCLVTIIVGVLLYNEPFDLWDFAISYLGGIHTFSGESNLASYLVFNLGMILCAMLSHRVSQFYHHARYLPHHRLYRFLFEICATGYMVMLMPHDVNDTVHSIGASMVFSSLWLYCVYTLSVMYRLLPKWKVLGCHVILQTTVLTYAFMYFTGSDLKQNFQKFAILGLMAVLWIISRYNYQHASQRVWTGMETGSATTSRE